MRNGHALIIGSNLIMIVEKIRISGTGCALADYLFTNVRFDSPGFLKYSSLRPGDGGVSPGKLVFLDELEKYAGKKYVEILKDISNDVMSDDFNIGGPGLVALIHASQLLLANDYEVRFFGCTGNDAIADSIFERLQATPLVIRDYKRQSNKTTSFTHVFSDFTYDNGHGERTFVNNIGAAWDYIPEMLTYDFFNAHIVCFGGTALVPQIHDNLTALLKKAKEHDCITVVNTVYDFRNEMNHPGIPWPLGDTRESLRLTDILIMDSEEALKISGKSSLYEASEYFLDHQVSSFLITNGTEEVIAYSNGNLFKKMEITRFSISEKILNELKSNPVLKRDTTGCGDNFAGGVIASIAWQLRSTNKGAFDLTDAVSWGVASGGFACFYVGGTYYEKIQGEKLEKVKCYQTAYLKQIGLK